MYGSDKGTDDLERTAFRIAEKKYKFYYDDTFKSSKKKKLPKQVDLSEVIDFKRILECYNHDGALPLGMNATQCDLDGPVFCLENRPGFYFIPGALSLEEQCQWIRESLTSFPQPPNRTNHNAIYGPIQDLFIAAKEKRVLVEANEISAFNVDSDIEPSVSTGNTHGWKFVEENTVSSRRTTCKSVPASVLLRKLRWSTLGLQFDWSKRSYDISLLHNKMPSALCQLAKRMAAAAMPAGEEFKPEAAIVNYFASGDSLGGHLDDMEADWSKPIVSMSLGCKAIFLLGGKSRQDPPVAMFLRSGDVVLMAGEARECFHGVPRIFIDVETDETSLLEKQFSNQDDLHFLEYIRTSRININIRQVF
ncbi:alpha-ketoglutarate-dependent dioxygenase alkB [Momordica charantia]|uniref:Alpha-ketoglutarate-dependent dioxygenase alkB n=1 Tax=Momordica charantia TaxID=3673 RepID=A0A6J1DG90_MOMCH|nr:alpha-ketoglutarate-dependent dioxygenase alkB [Momordica charantia]